MDSVAAHRAAEMFESVLLAPVLRPLISGTGLLGDYELDALAREVAARDDMFARLIARRLEHQ
ncbi:MAG: hypothetical protein JO263_02025 [Candidatus Eremiobacteraeota bacterium]|nr:hypothetical protein [Candidatus Eremiobacteraeota bacterium]